MNKYDELITLRDTFLDMLNIAVNNATTQEQFEELESITEEIFSRIPREIASCDYILRMRYTRIGTKICREITERRLAQCNI